MHHPHRTVLTLILTLGLIATSMHVSDAQLVPYDDFSEPLIDPDRWHGNETPSRGANPNTEAARFIDAGQLILGLRSYGGTDRDTGRRSGNFGLAVTGSGRVTAMQAEVTIRNALVEDCPDNPVSTRARAQLIGYFFNDGSSSGPGDVTGDVLASIEKRVDSRTGPGFLALIVKCASPGCQTSDTLGFHVFSTPTALGQADTLRLEWDEAGEQFTFTVNPGGPDEEVQTLSYAGRVTNMAPSDFQLDRLRVRTQGANCLSGRRQVMIDTRYDDVQLNLEATMP